MEDRLSPGGPLVSIIIVTWNSAAFLRKCIDALRSQTHRVTEIIAIDNASSDESVAILSSAGLDVIRNDSNRGFSAAVNQGIARAKGDFVLLCNPDAFLDARYVEECVRAMAEGVGSATGTLMREDGSGVDTAGIRMTRSGRHLDISDRSVNEVFGVSGAAGMYRMSFLRDVAVDGEIFDEDFFAYREDADIAWRGRLLGWRALHVPSATGRHVRRVTPERRRELPPEVNMHSVKNRFLLRWKNEGALLALRNAPFEIARDLVVVGAVLTIERSSLPALAWLWNNRERIMRKRRVIQQRRRVSDLALAKWFR
jgi:GT2 family glycosyltransferase